MTDRPPHRTPELPPVAPEPQWRRPGITPVSLFIVLAALYVLVKIQLVVVLVVLAILFATIIERPVMALHRRRIPRPLSILAVYVLIIGGIVLAGLLVAPTVADEADRFREEAPSQLRELKFDWQTSGNAFLKGPGVNVIDRILDEIDKPSSPSDEVTVGIVTGVGGGVVGLITVLVMAFYYLTEKALLRRIVINQVRPSSRERVERVWDQVEAQVGRWLRGQLTLCLIIGSLSFVGYGLLDVRFWPLLGLWAGITEIIPIVGPWLGGIPAVAIAASQSWDKAFMVAIFVVMLQFLENSILVPRVMRGAVGLTPLTVFVAILAGTQYLGVIGALLAIPIAAAIQVVVSEYFKGRREMQRAIESVSPGWRWMRGSTTTVALPPEPGSNGGKTAPTSSTPGTR
jgi:predicted PurR-regulated permease PerM